MPKPTAAVSATSDATCRRDVRANQRERCRPGDRERAERGGWPAIVERTDQQCRSAPRCPGPWQESCDNGVGGYASCRSPSIGWSWTWAVQSEHMISPDHVFIPCRNGVLVRKPLRGASGKGDAEVNPPPTPMDRAVVGDTPHAIQSILLLALQWPRRKRRPLELQSVSGCPGVLCHYGCLGTLIPCIDHG